MKTPFVAVILLALAGCAHTETKPEIVGHATALEPQLIPVPVPCLKKEQVPAPPATWMRAAKSGDYNELAAAIDLKEAKDYIVRSQSLLWGCVKSFEEGTTK